MTSLVIAACSAVIAWLFCAAIVAALCCMAKPMEFDDEPISIFAVQLAKKDSKRKSCFFSDLSA